MSIYERGCLGDDIRRAIDLNLGDPPPSDANSLWDYSGKAYVGEVRLSYHSHSTGLSIKAWVEEGGNPVKPYMNVTYWYFPAYYGNPDMWPDKGSPVYAAVNTLVKRLDAMTKTQNA